MKLTHEQKETLGSLRIYSNLEKEVEMARRMKFDLPLWRDPTVEGSKDMAEWQPGDLMPFREGEEIVWRAY